MFLLCILQFQIELCVWEKVAGNPYVLIACRGCLLVCLGHDF